MIRKAAGPLAQYWSSLPPWVKSGPLGVVFFLVVWGAALLFMDFRVNERQRVEDDRNAGLKQTAALQSQMESLRSLADDRREQTRLLAELVVLLKRPGNEKWEELNVLVRKLGGDSYGEDVQRAMRDWEDQQKGNR